MQRFGLITAWCLSAFVLFSVPAAARSAPESFAELSEKLSPAVVNISTSKEMKAAMPGGLQGSPFEGLPEGHPFEQFEDFFDRYFAPHGKSRKATSLGSGFVVGAEGYIVTNNHVIEEADEIKVTFYNEEEYVAEIVGRDTKTDLALLKIDAKKPLPFVSFGDSNHSRVGDWVLVIGNPFGLGGTVTAGIISARARNINAGPFDDFIQTDAAINRGNSGGPMFNMSGEVIGINTAIFSPGGLGNIGIGFAVPSALAKPVIEQLKETGSVERGWLGVRIQSVTEEIAESLGMEKPRGALVAEVMAASPAEKAGVKVGDVITDFDGKPVDEMRVLPRLVAETEIGKTVEVRLLRNGKETTVRVVTDQLREESASAGKETPEKTLKGESGEVVQGMSLSPLDDGLRETFGIAGEVNGLAVTDIDFASPAYEQGIRVGDVILEANREKTTRAQQVKDAVAKAKEAGRKSVLLLINRGGETLFIAVPVGE